MKATVPDPLTALEGKWMRQELCKCACAGLNPEAMPELVKACEFAVAALAARPTAPCDEALRLLRAALCRVKEEKL